MMLTPSCCGGECDFVTSKRKEFSLLRRLRSLLGLGAQLPRPQSAKPVTDPDPGEDRRARAKKRFGKRSQNKPR